MKSLAATVGEDEAALLGPQEVEFGSCSSAYGTSQHSIEITV